MSNTIVDDLGSSFTLEWYHERRVVLIALNASHHDAVDRVYEFLVNLVESWPSDQPYLSVYDATRSRFSFTPYLRQKALDLVRRFAHQQGRTAILLPRNMLGQVIRLFVKMDLYPVASKREMRVFFSLDEALVWLLESDEAR